MYLDAHCHLADPRLDAARDEVIARARSRHVTGFVQGGVGPDDWARQRELSRQRPRQIHAVYGLHPWWVDGHSDQECDRALELLEREYLDGVGLGELGLDRGGKRVAAGAGESGQVAWSRQKRMFASQLKLARGHGLPLVLHIVQAHEDALEIMTREGVPTRGGIVHSFSGDAIQARAYRALGLTISISGAVTRDDRAKAFDKLKAAVVSIPWPELIVESDAPDQPPKSHSTQSLNEPVTVWQVAEMIADLHGLGAGGAEKVLESSSTRVASIYGIQR